MSDYLIIFVHVYLVLCRHILGRVKLATNGRRYGKCGIKLLLTVNQHKCM